MLNSVVVLGNELWKYYKFSTEILQLPEMDVFIRGNQVDARGLFARIYTTIFFGQFFCRRGLGAKTIALMIKISQI